MSRHVLGLCLLAVAACAGADGPPSTGDEHLKGNGPASSNGVDDDGQGEPSDTPDAGGVSEDPNAPHNLRGYAGGKDIAIVWEGVPTATKYTIYRDGKSVGSALPRPPGTRFSSNATFVDTDVTKDQRYVYRVDATLANGTTTGKSAEVAVTHASKGTPIPNIILDASVQPSLKPYLETGKAFLETWYPKIGDLLASPDYAPPTTFTMKIDASPCGAGVTSGTVIGLCKDFAISQPNDLSIFAHEATHVMQAYAGAAYRPHMVVEGIASWGGDVATGYVQPKPPATSLFTEGYGTAEYFFDWIGRTYKQPTFARDLNVAAYKGSNIDALFVAKTQKNIGQLWSEMSGKKVSAPGPLKGPGGKCADLSYYNLDDGTNFNLLTCRGVGAQEIVVLQNDDATLTFRLEQKCLAPNAAGQVVIAGCNAGNAAQKWKVQNGAVINVGQNKCVQPTGGKTTDGTPLVLAACNGAAAQKWTINLP
jgi:hypothetical protein